MALVREISSTSTSIDKPAVESVCLTELWQKYKAQIPLPPQSRSFLAC